MSVIEAPTITELEEPQVMDEADQVLLDAERYIQEHGWTYGMYKAENGQVCLVGALLEVDASEEKIRAYKRLARTIWPNSLNITNVTRIQDLTNFITAWNDRQCNSKEEAIAMLRKARNRHE